MPRIRVWVLGWLCLLPCFAFGGDPAPKLDVAKLLTVPAFQARLERDKPVPTGDALFDRYAAEVWQRQAATSYLGQYDGLGALPDELLDSWEAEFGQDPRFWQLRFFVAKIPVGETEDDWSLTGSDPVPENAVAFLRHAVEIGAYDAATLRTLFVAEVQRFTDNPARGNWVLEPGAVDMLKPIADRMISSFPEEAESWYSLAFVCQADGNTDGAFVALQQGNAVNASPSNRSLTYFPLSVVLDSVSNSGTLAGPVMTGMVITADEFSGSLKATSLPVLRQFRKMWVESIQGQQDFAKCQILTDYASRVAQRRDSWFIEASLASAWSLSINRRFLVDIPETLSREQRDKLWTHNGWHNARNRAARDALMDAMPDFEDIYPEMFGSLLDSTGEVSDLAFAKLLILRMLDKEGLASEWFSQNLGWGVFTHFAKEAQAEHGAPRDALVKAAQELGTWDWNLLDYRKTEEQLQQEAADQALMERLDKGEITIDQAVDEVAKRGEKK